MIRFQYLTTKHLSLVESIVGYRPHMEKVLSSLGFKICVFSNGKPIFLWICVYGTKPKHAYLAEVWRDSSVLAARVFSHVRKYFDKTHENWTVVLTSNDISKYYRHVKKFNDKLYQYTGNLK